MVLHPRLKSRADADRALLDMIHLNSLLSTETARRDAAVQAAEQQNAAQIEALTGKLEVRSQALEAWARRHREREFGEGQSLELSNGTLAFRVQPRAVELLEGWTWKSALAKLTGKFWGRYLRLAPAINKAKILDDTKPDAPLRSALDPKRLKAIGLCISQGEGFDVSLREGPVKVTRQR
jgi:phage host-nuclease inhibitor protein Gam